MISPTLRFPRILQNQNFAGTYFVIIMDETMHVNHAPESFLFDAKLRSLGWNLTQNAAPLLVSQTGSGPMDTATRDKYTYVPAYFKEVRNSELHIPFGDVREALGMPREEQFAQISEITISLVFPHAIKSLPTDIQEDLHKAIDEKIEAYVRLGQESLHVLNGYSQSTEIRASVIIRGRVKNDQPMIQVVTDRDEWKPFIDKVTEFASIVLKRFEDRVQYDQTIDTAVIC
jgi:hypothetical protein